MGFHRLHFYRDREDIRKDVNLRCPCRLQPARGEWQRAEGWSYLRPQYFDFKSSDWPSSPMAGASGLFFARYDATFRRPTIEATSKSDIAEQCRFVPRAGAPEPRNYNVAHAQLMARQSAHWNVRESRFGAVWAADIPAAAEVTEVANWRGRAMTARRFE
jgi:hypothetical protein